jgi:hypothetical protein
MHTNRFRRCRVAMRKGFGCNASLSSAAQCVPKYRLRMKPIAVTQIAVSGMPEL